MKIELGDEVQDKVTNFKGIVTAIAKCLTGCDRVEVRPQSKKTDEMKDAYWVDDITLKIIKKDKAGLKLKPKKKKAKTEVGGPPARSSRRY